MLTLKGQWHSTLDPRFLASAGERRPSPQADSEVDSGVQTICSVGVVDG